MTVYHLWPLHGKRAKENNLGEPDRGCQACWECDKGLDHKGPCDCYCKDDNAASNKEK